MSHLRFREGDLEVWDFSGVEVADLETVLEEVRAKSKYPDRIEKRIRVALNGEMPLGDSTKGELQIRGLSRLLETRWRSECDWHVRFPTGKGGLYGHVGIWQRGYEAAALLAVTEDNRIPLVVQFRHSRRQKTLELPRGCIDPSDKGPEAAALREGKEEAGLIPSSKTKVTSLGDYAPDTGLIAYVAALIFADEMQHLGDDFEPSPDEAIHEVKFFTPRELFELFRNGGSSEYEIADGHTMAALFLAAAKGLLPGVTLAV